MIATVYQVTAASTNFTLVQCDDIDRYLQVEAKRARAAPFTNTSTLVSHPHMFMEYENSGKT